MSNSSENTIKCQIASLSDCTTVSRESFILWNLFLRRWLSDDSSWRHDDSSWQARLAVPASEERYLLLDHPDRSSEEESAVAARVSSVDDDDCGGVLLPLAGSCVR